MSEEKPLTAQQEEAVRLLLVQATTHVARDSGQPWLRATLRRVTRGRLGRYQPWYPRARLGMPWEDFPSNEREGWRTRAAYADSTDDAVFEVDYMVCAQCQLAWVEQPYTVPAFQRRGIASAGLAALRTEHPGMSWHTLGGHESDSRPFWTAAGTGVSGRYQRRKPCPHITMH